MNSSCLPFVAGMWKKVDGRVRGREVKLLVEDEGSKHSGRMAWSREASTVPLWRLRLDPGQGGFFWCSG